MFLYTRIGEINEKSDLRLVVVVVNHSVHQLSSRITSKPAKHNGLKILQISLERLLSPKIKIDDAQEETWFHPTEDFKAEYIK